MVYPRVCGGTLMDGNAVERMPCKKGLSPRVRGNLTMANTLVRIGDSLSGLSPRVRGNQRNVVRQARPLVTGGLSPRVRGNPSGRASGIQGLSPRVRGNPAVSDSLADERRISGSIPACAGEPAPTRFLAFLTGRGVYPRVCGGTPQAYASAFSSITRSIPACAGEPVSSRLETNCARQKVYPRVCGGTPKRSLLVSTSAKELPLNCTSPGRSRQHRLSPSAPLPIPEFAGRLPPMAPSRSLLSIPAASRHTTQPILSKPSPVCHLSCLATCIHRALSPTWPRQENLDNALRH